MMRFVAVAIVVLAVLATPAWAQPAEAPAQDALGRRVMTAVRAALDPALPYPPSNEAGDLPLDETSSAPWMVRPLQAGDRSIEVIANPLNPDHQARSAKAMAQIEVAVEAAQRKSQAQYERALAEAQRTGRSQNVDGITLADEGVAGARIDAESHVVIDVLVNEARYAFRVASSVPPLMVPEVSGPLAVVSVPDNVYRERPDGEERYCQARAFVFFGGFGRGLAITRSGVNFDITFLATDAAQGGAPVRTLVVTLAGNRELIDDILRKTDWSRLRALLEP